MKRRVRKYNSGEEKIELEYVLPSDFKITKPEYHCDLEILLGTTYRAEGWPLATVIYAIVMNDKKERYKDGYDARAIFTWNLKNFSLPGYAAYRTPDEHEHYFKQYLEEGHFNFNKHFDEFVKEAKEAGFDNIVCSFGIWTEEGIINERFLPCPAHIPSFAEEYHLLQEELATIYNNSPDLIKHNLATVFTDPLICDNERRREICQDILDTVFDKPLKDVIENEYGHELMSDGVFVMLNRLNSETKPLLKTMFCFKLSEERTAKVDVGSFLAISVAFADEDREIPTIYDSEGIEVEINEVLRKAPLSIYSEVTDELRELRGISNAA